MCLAFVTGFFWFFYFGFCFSFALLWFGLGFVSF